jgi:K+-sensing histidine kinase KdpD
MLKRHHTLTLGASVAALGFLIAGCSDSSVQSANDHRVTPLLSSNQKIRLDEVEAGVQLPLYDGVLSGLYVPLRFRGQTIGVLCIESLRKDEFDFYDQSLIVVIASHLASLADYTRLREEAEGRARNLGLIHEVVQLRRHDLEKSSIAIDVETSTFAQVQANVTELEQVTLNFVINAQQAIESAGKGHGRILIHLTEAGKKVRLEVQDDGPGVSPENEPKLFQPFFTTKPTGEGTGLGLSISYDIVTQQHGGTITVDSRIGEFTEFTIRLPRSFQASAAA